MTEWDLIPSLAQGQDPLILDEVGEFEEGDGIRATLFPYHLLIQLKTPHREAHLLISIADILDAVGEMTKEMGS